MDETMLGHDGAPFLFRVLDHPTTVHFADVPISLRRSIYQFLGHSRRIYYPPNYYQNFLDYGDYPYLVDCGYSMEAVQFWIDQYLSDPRHRWFLGLFDFPSSYGVDVNAVSPPLIFDVLEQRKALARSLDIVPQLEWHCCMEREFELIIPRHGPLCVLNM